MSDIFEDIGNKNKDTKVQSKDLSGDKYTVFSLPKEILDIFSNAVNTYLAGGTLPGTYFSASLHSDMNLKSRLLALSKISLFSFLSFSVIIICGIFLFDKSTIFTSILIIVFFMCVSLGALGGYAYWYGRISGLLVDRDLSAKIIRNSTTVFRRTSLIFLFFKLLFYSFILFIFAANIKYILQGIAKELSTKTFSLVFGKIFGPENISSSIAYLNKAITVDYTNFGAVLISLMIVFTILSVIVILQALKKGKALAKQDAKNSYELYLNKQGNLFDKALRVFEKEKML